MNPAPFSRYPCTVVAASQPTPKSFWIETLGCKVNAAESDRVEKLLRSYGLTPADDRGRADIRIVNSCSVTTAAAAQSRQATRKLVRLPLLTDPAPADPPTADSAWVVAMGCWATSHPAEAAEVVRAVGGAVLTHHQDSEAQLRQLLESRGLRRAPVPLPQWGLAPERQSARQRAFLKVQDGCDAHCTYCIIPKLRTRLWSMPPEEAVTEVRRLVAAGHHEVVLTGIFLGAYGHPTALRRRQNPREQGGSHLARLVEAIGREVPELPRLRISSLEPGDLGEPLLEALRNTRAVVPHFHLPLQSGSERVLRKMNRQYTAADFVELVDRLRAAFDRPALTTDIVAGFPGESEQDFAETADIVRRCGFVHVHAFPYSPRPGTAASRWTDQAVPNAIANARVAELTRLAAENSLAYRQGFVGQRATIIIERGVSARGHRHGRCERWFDIELDAAVDDPAAEPAAPIEPGDRVEVIIDRVEPDATFGRRVTVPIPIFSEAM